MADAEHSSEQAAGRYHASMAAVKRHLDREDFAQALPFCNKAIELRKDCSVAQRCRVFALLSLSRWADALAACDKFSGTAGSFAFERAYALYRLNRLPEALAALQSLDAEADAGGRKELLKAQIHYRLGDYALCSAKYQDLYEHDPGETGLLVNAVASRVSGDASREAVRLLDDHADLLASSYELCFNLGCAHIEEGKLSQAETRLHEAKRLCVAELLQTEDLAEDSASQLEEHEELAMIHTQQAYLLQRQGGDAAKEEANELYARVLAPRDPEAQIDPAVRAVACNNVVALRSQGKSLFDSLKRIGSAAQGASEHALTQRQAVQIGVNRVLLLLEASRLDEARRELSRLRGEHPGDARVALAHAALAQREKKAKGCEESLLAFLQEHPECEEVRVCLAHFYSQQKSHDKAAETMAQLPARSRAQPHMVLAIVGLHQRQRSFDKAVACLREAIAYWTSVEGGGDEETFGAVLRIAARLALQLKDKAFAAEAFQLYLERVDGCDQEALCGLVSALASTDPARAAAYAQRLPAADCGHIDAEELEAGPLPKMALHARRGADREPGASGDGAAAAAEAAKATKKKRQTPRFPKNFDPENPGPAPDPERWLPKNQRAEFKKKMRKRDKNLARGPQGSMPADDGAFRKQGPSTAQVELAKDPVRPAARNQGKKAKGKK